MEMIGWIPGGSDEKPETIISQFNRVLGLLDLR